MGIHKPPSITETCLRHLVQPTWEVPEGPRPARRHHHAAARDLPPALLDNARPPPPPLAAVLLPQEECGGSTLMIHLASRLAHCQSLSARSCLLLQSSCSTSGASTPAHNLITTEYLHFGLSY